MLKLKSAYFLILSSPFIFLFSGCMDESNEQKEKQRALTQEFQDAVYTLNQSYGSPEKADFALLRNPCELLNPIFEWGEEAIKSGFFMGAGGQGTLGPAIGLGGYDVVWDFYHSQITVSAYHGIGLNLAGGAGITASLYADGSVDLKKVYPIGMVFMSQFQQK